MHILPPPQLLFGGIPCSFALGWTLMHVRQRAALRVAERFREAWPGFEGVSHKFFDASEVEVRPEIRMLYLPSFFLLYITHNKSSY